MGDWCRWPGRSGCEMGHTASGNVKMISVRPDSTSPEANSAAAAAARRVRSITQPKSCILENPNHIENLVESFDFTQIHSIQDISDVKSKLQEAEEKARTLARELAEVEGCNAELGDQVMWLEEEVDTARKKLMAKESYEETLNAKDQYILRLEGENKAIQEQIRQLKRNQNRKVRNLQIQLAQAKQDAALTLMQAKESIQELEEMIQLTRDKRINARGCKGDLGIDTEPSSEHVAEDKSHIRLVLELSSQLAEQQEKIRLLERSLQERDEQLRALEAQHPTQPAGGALGPKMLQTDLRSSPGHRACSTVNGQRVAVSLGTECVSSRKPPSGRKAKRSPMLRLKEVKDTHSKLLESSTSPNKMSDYALVSSPRIGYP
ncbi:uncharacterized protein LOC103178049 isoform X1 [Callorhinchus milii]|uniref:uncharacterized protein LOC103178049 isoform X1 n=1 Tax=Callorhinchus milii TaxID=7868 RepID=UPI000457160C|nr:uncharacterized protein LOC103178049 isoform X1 [Callorhinchus milii]|eukprot:gi/632950443/ref/XP_007890729.1/ PREDICTED: tropomyosin alpha-4 chain-like isoform X1 [Callorhinchus milii]